MKLSIISPVYNAEKIVKELIKRITREVEEITTDYEIILVEDGSPDESWSVIEELCLINSKLKGIRLSRNFGQHIAILAALEATAGDYVVVMDCDLQDNPKYIKDLIDQVNSGVEIVYTIKQNRNYAPLKNMMARLYYWTYRSLGSNTNYNADLGNYTLLSRKVVDAFCEVRDRQRHYLLVLQWLGFKSSSIEVEHDKRHYGKSSYGINELISFTINGVVYMSEGLLRLSAILGVVFFILGLFFFGYGIYEYIDNGVVKSTRTLMGLISLSTSIILFAIGILGLYIGKVFEQIKDRPLYLISDKINFE